ncbi:MAG: biotin carboxylase N-terminal domain-containing protein [Candidatus Nanopelagicales bacterium]|nr:biotin carboxylase N-terminal domain-containing protein [Candidatus Nanopelagicales bacterium]MDZ4248909.1 biotin carboxylase N-terminal domain-containing protein [Candidatus Nanopelagicales bacterium]
MDGTPKAEITRLLVANRGEIAVRVFETARDMGMTRIAVFSDVDRDARHVKAADYAVRLPGVSSADTYLNAEAIIEAALRTRADAIHPGYGFLAENPDFAQAVLDAGLKWVGPPPEAIRAMALKVEAKRTAAEVGLPLIPGAEIPDSVGDSELADLADGVGYPLLVKASAGGGGKGMRLVSDPSDLNEAVAAARREASAAFGNATVFLERNLPRARHVEVQIFGDTHGNYLHLFERECSIQRRHQKIIEEAPSPGATMATRSRMYAAALALARRIGYVGAGTVEFMVCGDGDAQEFFFLEMNTRLQVEHRVTEQITGTDLVQWQLLVAQGTKFNIEQDDLAVDGHAIEVRLYAEDPARDFLPGAGRLTTFEIPLSLASEVDSGYSAGDTVPSQYDPLIAKIITHDGSRESAARDMIEVLDETSISGIPTNREMLLAVLRSFPFYAGDTTTAFLTEHPDVTQPQHADVLLEPVAYPLAAVFRYLSMLDVPGDWAQDPFASSFSTDPVPPRWRNVLGTPGFVRLASGGDGAGEMVWVLLERTADDNWQVALGSGDGPYGTTPRDLGTVRVTNPACDESGMPLAVPGSHFLIEAEGLITRLSAEVGAAGELLVRGPDGNAVYRVVGPDASEGQQGPPAGPIAPVPGTVALVAVSPGQAVSAGETLVVLEAMKMEHRIRAESDATVVDVHVKPGQSVEAHAMLVTLSASAGESSESSEPEAAK